MYNKANLRSANLYSAGISPYSFGFYKNYPFYRADSYRNHSAAFFKELYSAWLGTGAAIVGVRT